MLRLKGQTESGEWVEFYPVDIVDTFEDEIKILLDKEIWVYADTIQPADDPRKAMLDEIRSKIYDNLNEVDDCGNIHRHMMIFGSDVYDIIDEMGAKL